MIWVVVLVIAAGLFWWVTHSKSSSSAQQSRLIGGPSAVTVATARRDSIGVYQEAIGTVTPVYTSSIVSQVTGMVTAVHYKEGQLVKKGEDLIDIDARSFEATLAQAQGTLEKDKQTLAQAEMDLERYRAAWARNAISRQTLDDQEKLVAQDRGTVQADQGAVNYDKVQVGYCKIRAPFAGRVGLRLIDPGNVVSANGTSALAVVTQEQPITVIFTIAEDSIGTVTEEFRKQKSLTVEAYDRTALKKIATGKLLTLDNQIDTTTGTVKLRAQFDNKDGALFPNQFVNARLLVKTLDNVVLVPTSSIQHNGQVAFVYVIQNGQAVVRNVKTGPSEAGLTVVEGVENGEVIANSSFEKLAPNAKVNVVDPNAQQGASQAVNPQSGAKSGSSK
ncbi:MAG: efflux RND transporter periplasmic adaptor subunit [Acidobacteriota bacterium]|nr:efflux RND transporter periplasmic adaptor subunit [Acidobacteriota bacterium]